MMTADRLNTGPCPVAPLVPEAIALIRALKRYDDHDCADLWRKTARRLEALETAAAALPATSSDGVFFQACIAFGSTDWWDTFSKDEAKEQKAKRDVMVRALGNLALAHWSERVAALGQYYMTFVVDEAQAA